MSRVALVLQAVATCQVLQPNVPTSQAAANAAAAAPFRTLVRSALGRATKLTEGRLLPVESSNPIRCWMWAAPV